MSPRDPECGTSSPMQLLIADLGFPIRVQRFIARVAWGLHRVAWGCILRVA